MEYRVILIVTNMGTRIAVSVSPDITVADFKRELEREHFNFFPTLGKIKAHGLMVRRKRCFYYLTESLPIKYAFQGLKGTWFLHVEVQPLSNLDKPGLSSSSVAKRIDQHVFDGSNVSGSFVHSEKVDIHNRNEQKIRDLLSTQPLAEERGKDAFRFHRKGKKSSIHLDNGLDNREKRPDAAGCENGVSRLSKSKVKLVVGSSMPSAETPRERSQGVELTRLINDNHGNSSVLNFESKCFNPRSSEVTSTAISSDPERLSKGKVDDYYSIVEADASAKFATVTPPRKPPCTLTTGHRPESSANKLKRAKGVGGRILIAANNLKESRNMHRSVISLYGIRGFTRLSSVSRISMFEISDNDN